ncbi:hypothetical protein QFZ97_004236 [Paraburkholderia youngii]
MVAMSRIRTLSARSCRITARANAGRTARVRRTWRDRPLSRTEWALLAAWAWILMSVLWVVPIARLIRSLRQTY